jgi:aspartate racemase
LNYSEKLSSFLEKEGALMKTIGLVGGTGWISTVEYYRIINEETNRRLGGLEFARCALYSVNFGDIWRFEEKRETEGIFSLMLTAAKKLESIGADCILLCANTMHMHADRVEKEISVPLIHIAKATGAQILKKSMKTVGLLGTRPTMELDFYTKKLAEQGITVIVPEKDERVFIQRIINSELLRGIFLPESKQRFLDIIQKLRSQGAEGVVLGCTEIPLLIKQEDIDVPLFNTTVIHSQAAVDFALGEDKRTHP